MADADATAVDSRVGTKTWIRYVANVQASDTNLVGDPHTFTITASVDNGSVSNPGVLTDGVAPVHVDRDRRPSSGATLRSPGTYTCNLPCSVTVNSAVAAAGHDHAHPGELHLQGRRGDPHGHPGHAARDHAGRLVHPDQDVGELRRLGLA